MIIDTQSILDSVYDTACAQLERLDLGPWISVPRRFVINLEAHQWVWGKLLCARVLLFKLVFGMTIAVVTLLMLMQT